MGIITRSRAQLVGDPELGQVDRRDGGEKLTPEKGYLQPGDVIECELEKIGVLRNNVREAA